MMHLQQGRHAAKAIAANNNQPDAPSCELGQRLRDAREKHKISIDQVSSRLKIRGQYLRALEEGRFSNIPGKIYVEGYLKNYADYLGIDREDLLEAAKHSARFSSPDDPFMLPDLAHDGMRPKKYLVALSVLMLIGVYVLWSMWETSSANARPTAAATREVHKPAPMITEARIVLLAKNDMEITLLDAEGNVLEQRLMHSGDTHFMPASAALLLSSSREDMQLFVDGEPVSPFGSNVMTPDGIVMNADKLLIDSGLAQAAKK